jgi:hypothetical protein
MHVYFSCFSRKPQHAWEQTKVAEKDSMFLENSKTIGLPSGIRLAGKPFVRQILEHLTFTSKAPGVNRFIERRGAEMKPT